MKPASIIITRFPFTSQLGGEEIHTFQVAEALREHGHSVEFLTSCPILRKYAKNNGFNCRKIWLFKPPVSIPTYAIFTLLSPILFIWSLFVLILLKISRPNLKIYSLSFTEKLLFAPWCWMLKIPMVWVEHARIGNWFHKNGWKFWYKFWAVGDSVKIVTVSKVMKNDLGIAGVKIIPNAIDQKVFSKIYDVSILPEEVRKSLQKSKFDIGYVGRLSQDKGMELLIELKLKHPEIGITTIGSGPYRELLEDHGINNFPFLNKEQIACFMQSIDLLVLPATETDPFGLVVLEAMAAKCPTLITTKVGVSDYLANKAESLICKPEEFAATAANSVKDKALLAKLKEQGEKAITRFDHQEMLNSYIKLFE